MGKNPSFQFYPADWKKDLELQACSLEARGLWIELMCIMHHANPYGTLRVNGEIPPPKVVSHLVGIHPSRYRRLLSELERYGVIKKDEHGAYYSKRMVDDHRLREIRREAGAKGGNPNLVNQSDKQTEKQKPTPSSSSSSSSSSSKPNTTTNETDNLSQRQVERFEMWYEFYPRKRGRGEAEKAWNKIKPDDELLERMIGATKSQVAAGELKAKDKYTPYPATWLNRKSWEDEIEGDLDYKPKDKQQELEDWYTKSCPPATPTTEEGR